MASNIPLIHVTVHKKDGIVFEGNATSISSTNEKGVFDILPMHTNFVAIINTTLTIRVKDTIPTVMSIPRGIIHVKANVVEIFVGV
jgi:F0F1-type ATP synthase epsilon subunit